MKKPLLISYLAVFLLLFLPKLLNYRALPQIAEEQPAALQPEAAEVMSTAEPKLIKVLRGEELILMDREEYLLGVLAAEMPASFPRLRSISTVPFIPPPSSS